MVACRPHHPYGASMNRHNRKSSPITLGELHSAAKEELPEFLLKRCGGIIYQAAVSASAGNRDLLDDCLYFSVLTLLNDNFIFVRTFKGRSSFEGFIRAAAVRTSLDTVRRYEGSSLPVRDKKRADRAADFFSACPSDEEIALFVERKSADKRHDKARSHCSSCSRCAERLRCCINASRRGSAVPKEKMERVFAAALSRTGGSSLRRVASLFLFILAAASLGAAAVASYLLRR